MRYIKVWHDWNDVPQELRPDVAILLGSYFQEQDAIDTINAAYGEGTWEGLGLAEQAVILSAVDEAFESLGGDDWDYLLLDAIPDEIKKKLGDPKED